jgi:hypothetical protein
MALKRTSGQPWCGLSVLLCLGVEGRQRATNMAAWTRQHGKDDAINLVSKQNYDANR